MAGISHELTIGLLSSLAHSRWQFAVEFPEDWQGLGFHNWSRSSGLALPLAIFSRHSLANLANAGRGVSSAKILAHGSSAASGNTTKTSTGPTSGGVSEQRIWPLA